MKCLSYLNKEQTFSAVPCSFIEMIFPAASKTTVTLPFVYGTGGSPAACVTARGGGG
jgi:hypothetical protein